MQHSAVRDVCEFLSLDTEAVLQRFATLPKAVAYSMVSNDEPDYVYVPGTRADRVLLVAHADTVSNVPPTARLINRELGVLSLRPKAPMVMRSLGADDRAGCAMLWRLRASGHSLLVTNDEERGCLGAEVAAKTMAAELARHRFMVEVDRRGTQEVVFYDVATRRFRRHVLRSLPGFVERMGSFSDISVLAPEAQICAVNVSAGYRNEHSRNETLNAASWLTTLRALEGWLLRTELKGFPLPPDSRRQFRCGHNPWGEYAGYAYVMGGDDEDERPFWNSAYADEDAAYLHNGRLYCFKHLPYDASPGATDKLGTIPDLYCCVCQGRERQHKGAAAYYDGYSAPDVWDLDT